MRRLRQLNINLRPVFHHAEATRRCAEERDEGLREEVLAGVLLQVIEASRPIDDPAHARANVGYCAREDVKHAFAFEVKALNDGRAVERAGVKGLTAARRVESGAVEDDGGAPVAGLGDADNLRVKFRQVRVVVVEAFGGHRFMYGAEKARLRQRRALFQSRRSLASRKANGRTRARSSVFRVVVEL